VKSKQTTNWWIDVLLFAGFILTFFLDLTGFELHQWLGVLTGALAGWHLLRHLNWAASVTKRFFSRTSNRARSFYLLDALLFSSFLLILITGLVISTWLTLPLNNYITWVSVHITASVTALVALLLKILLHWRWITSTANRIARSMNAPAAGQPAHARASAVQIDRRDFLKVLGISGAASMLALGSASSALSGILERSTAAQDTAELEPVKDADTQTTAEAPGESRAEISSSEAESTSHGGGGNRRRGGRGENINTPAAETPAAEEPSDAPAPEAVPETVPTEVQPTPETCIVQCPRSCTYPGQCRKYVDANGNGLCDLGECL